MHLFPFRVFVGRLGFVVDGTAEYESLSLNLLPWGVSTFRQFCHLSYNHCAHNTLKQYVSI